MTSFAMTPPTPTTYASSTAVVCNPSGQSDSPTTATKPITRHCPAKGEFPFKTAAVITDRNPDAQDADLLTHEVVVHHRSPASSGQAARTMTSTVVATEARPSSYSQLHRSRVLYEDAVLNRAMRHRWEEAMLRLDNILEKHAMVRSHEETPEEGLVKSSSSIATASHNSNMKLQQSAMESSTRETTDSQAGTTKKTEIVDNRPPFVLTAPSPVSAERVRRLFAAMISIPN